MKIRLKYKPRDWAKKMHGLQRKIVKEEGRLVFDWSSKGSEFKRKRWIVLNIHRRGGKTVASVNHLIRDALSIPKSRWAYIAPTYKQAKNVAWKMIKEYCRHYDNDKDTQGKEIKGISFNESDLTVTFPNGSTITLYGADNPDSLRGIGLHGAIFDEYSQQPSQIFDEIIRPALSDHKGYAIWIATPQGRNDFYRVCQKAQKEKDWHYVELKASTSGIVGAEELEALKSEMTEDAYQQEYECSFDAATKGAYYEKELALARKENRMTRIPHNKQLPVHTWWDIGVSDATSIGFFQNHMGKWYMIDYFEATGEGVEYYIGVLNEKTKENGYVYGEHYMPHDIQVRSFSTGQSRLETCHSLGFYPNVLPKLSIVEGIAAVRRRFNTLYIDTENCQAVIDSLSLYRKKWNERLGIFENKPVHDEYSHCADMVRYWGITDHFDEGAFFREEASEVDTSNIIKNYSR